MATWPKLADVRTFLRLQPDAAEDAVVDNCRTAAVDYGQQVLGADPATGLPLYPDATTTLPASAFQACLQHSARLYKRRDSLDGTTWFGDGGAGRVAARDPDVDKLYALYAPLVFG
jgi:hypothetical protein